MLCVIDTAGPSGQQLPAAATASGRSLRSRHSTAAAPTAASEESASHEGAAGESASLAGPRAEPEGESDEADKAAAGAAGGKSLEELAVRFSQATKELQASTPNSAMIGHKLCRQISFLLCMSMTRSSYACLDGSFTPAA